MCRDVERDGGEVGAGSETGSDGEIGRVTTFTDHTQISKNMSLSERPWTRTRRCPPVFDSKPSKLGGWRNKRGGSVAAKQVRG